MTRPLDQWSAKVGRCEAIVSRYSGDRYRLVVTQADTGEPVLTTSRDLTLGELESLDGPIVFLDAVSSIIDHVAHVVRGQAEDP